MVYTLRGSRLRVLAVAITVVQDYFQRIDERAPGFKRLAMVRNGHD